jgi:hypothetical protein
MDKILEECEKLSIDKTTKYLNYNPEGASKGAETEEKQIQQIENFYLKKISSNQQTTKPDYLVSLVLESKFDHEKSDRELIQKQYNNQKQTEMMIGNLLELYILREGKDFGWAFTAQCISAVDFIKEENTGWTLFQIKNSDNTENSSAKAIREGTQIKKWFRRYSSPKIISPRQTKKGEIWKDPWTKKYPEIYEKRKISKDFSDFEEPDFNWEKFPDENLKKKLSEKGFKDFVLQYLK